MPTLETIKFRDLIRVNAVSGIVNRDPLVVRVEGEDFTNVDEVLVNDIKVEEFIVVNQKEMLITMPGSVRQIRTVSVRSSNFTRTSAASFVDYKVGDKTRAVSGILRLTQLFVRYLLTSPGSDIFNPGEGGGLQDAVGVLGSTNKTAPILAAVSRSVQQAADQIVRNQLSQTNLPLDERLLTATVLELGTTASLDEVVARVLLTSYAGTDATVNLQL